MSKRLNEIEFDEYLADKAVWLGGSVRWAAPVPMMYHRALLMAVGYGPDGSDAIYYTKTINHETGETTYEVFCSWEV